MIGQIETDLLVLIGNTETHGRVDQLEQDERYPAGPDECEDDSPDLNQELTGVAVEEAIGVVPRYP